MKKQNQTIEIYRQDLESIGQKLAGWYTFKQRTVWNITEDKEGDNRYGEINLFGNRLKVEQMICQNWSTNWVISRGEE